MPNFKKHTVQFRVYVEDTDMMAIVYHSNYLAFFERARTEMLRENGISLTTMAKYGTYFAIYDAHIRYLYPAKLDDILLIGTNCTLARRTLLKFNQIMHNQDGILLSEATIQVVSVNSHLKPKRIPDEWDRGK